MNKIINSPPLIKVMSLRKEFVRNSFLGIPKSRTIAVDDVSFEIRAGQTMGLVGESGCGKSTLGRLLVRLYKPDSGKILLNGVDICALNEDKLRPFRKDLQIIFQDPYSSLNSKLTVKEILIGGLRLHKICSRKEENNIIQFLLELVGLSKDDMYKYPNEFSGGQCQRIGIARSISVEPKFIVCDEAISALDVVVQRQIIDMLKELQAKMGIAYLFISHNIAAVRRISDVISVMYQGRLVEIATADEVCSNPLHPYTKQLILSSTNTDLKNTYINKSPESNTTFTTFKNCSANSSGCNFFDQCKNRIDICKYRNPDLRSVNADHKVACHLFSAEQ